MTNPRYKAVSTEYKLREILRTLLRLQYAIRALTNKSQCSYPRSNLNSVEQTVHHFWKHLITLKARSKILTLQISNEEDNMIANKLNEQEIIAAYHMAQDLYENGTLNKTRRF